MSVIDKIKKYKAACIVRYCPLLPRLCALISHPVFSHLFHYGDEHMKNNKDPNVVEDIHQAELWSRFAKNFPLKSEGTHGICDLRIALGISADRASLSKHKPKNDYAILPILLSIVNWPIWIRNQEKYLLLSSIPPLKSHKPNLYFGNKNTKKMLIYFFEFIMLYFI